MPAQPSAARSVSASVPPSHPSCAVSCFRSRGLLCARLPAPRNPAHSLGRDRALRYPLARFPLSRTPARPPSSRSAARSLPLSRSSGSCAESGSRFIQSPVSAGGLHSQHPAAAPSSPAWCPLPGLRPVPLGFPSRASRSSPGSPRRSKRLSPRPSPALAYSLLALPGARSEAARGWSPRSPSLGAGSSSGSSSGSSIRLRPGERLTLSLESPPGVNPSIVWKSPGSKKYEDKSLSLTQLGRQESGTWECIVSYNKKTLVVKINIFVLGKRGPSPLQTAPCRLPPASLADRPCLCSHCFAPGGKGQREARARLPPRLRETLGSLFIGVMDIEERRDMECKDVRSPRDPPEEAPKEACQGHLSSLSPQLPIPPKVANLLTLGH